MLQVQPHRISGLGSADFSIRCVKPKKEQQGRRLMLAWQGCCRHPIQLATPDALTPRLAIFCSFVGSI